MIDNNINKFTENDKKYMRMAINLAQKAKGYTSPNPVVGAVIVKDGTIISKGYHKKAGGPHAEIEAINACSDKTKLKDSSMYVTLEPCTIYGKTPPCVDSIIKYGFAEIVIGSTDFNPRINGSGIQALKKAGIRVRAGLFGEEIKKQNEIFFKHIIAASPFICCKIASSIDGKIAAKSSDSKWITSGRSRKMVQKIRKEYDCIMTGINTILVDDPLLYPRKNAEKFLIANNISNDEEDFASTVLPDIKKGKQFYRVILDSGLKLPPDSNIVMTANFIKTIVFTSNKISKDDFDYKAGHLSQKNIDIIRVNNYQSENKKTLLLDLKEILGKLYSDYGITSVFLESGPTLVTEFLKNNLIDKFIFFLAPKIIGGDSNFNMFSVLNINKIDDVLRINFETVKKIIGSGKNSADTDIIIVAYPSINNSNRDVKCLQE
ncbi:MAG: bifunctional diaminohydroxyphosphoribosylaminopyrimidine deaminase/5-amino-6-(5-phosphoribosylamino)uracil reductase RibD [Actinobacteria bacterium]|nr:bifunctional diaminohydroxyphosphoribosylaminopyrimidine deaminase/5-amino-6-(5-phosphoribosylamino)uracil reductase RibD [Actinomycetota bacterium]